MAKKIRQGFQKELINLVISELLFTKNVSIQVRQGRKYAQILSSIREVGLIEAPVVAPLKKEKGYLLLDGHLRIMALKELGENTVSCLISTDDEAYTYNKYVNKLTAIQEHRMIVKALQSGVSEEKLASALNLNLRTLKNKKILLEGICSDAIELLKDKPVPEPVFRALRKMKASRQIAVAQLMNDQNRFSSSYAQALLEGTPPEQLAKTRKSKKLSPVILARQIRLEEENLSLTAEIGAIKDLYGKNMVDITSMQSYLKRLLGNEKVAEYLRKYHEPIYEKFSEFVALDFFRLRNID